MFTNNNNADKVLYRMDDSAKQSYGIAAL